MCHRHSALVEGVDGRRHGTAAVVAEDDDERNVEDVDGILDGAEHGAVDDVTRGADHEHVAEPLVEDDLCGDAGVSAAEQHGGGMLTVDELGATVDSLARVQRGTADETMITLGQGFPGGDGIGVRHAYIIHLRPCPISFDIFSMEPDTRPVTGGDPRCPWMRRRCCAGMPPRRATCRGATTG